MIWNWGQRFHSKELFFILLWAIKERIDIPISPNLKGQPLILDVKWNSCFYSFCCCTCFNKILSRKEILKKFNINHDAFYLNFWHRGSDRNGWRPCTISVICLPTLKILTSSLKSIKGVYLINTPPPQKKLLIQNISQKVLSSTTANSNKIQIIPIHIWKSDVIQMSWSKEITCKKSVRNYMCHNTMNATAHDQNFKCQI